MLIVQKFYCLYGFWLVLVASVSVSGQRYNNWNGGNRGGGYGTHYRNPHYNHNRYPSSSNNNNNYYSNQGNYNGNQGNYNTNQDYKNYNNNPGQNGYTSEREAGCNPPTFTDQALFEVEGCGGIIRAQHRHHCLSYASWIPAGKQGSMICRRGRRQLRLKSVCTRQGTWDPPFEAENCDQLFEMQANYKTGHQHITNDQTVSPSPTQSHNNQNTALQVQGNDRRTPCNKLQIKLTSNFILMCQLPGQISEVENCLRLYERIPSGTKVSLRCRPPYQNLDRTPSDLVCNDGTWEGQMKKVVCSYTGISEITTSSTTTTTTTTTTPRPYITTTISTPSPAHIKPIYPFTNYGGTPNAWDYPSPNYETPFYPPTTTTSTTTPRSTAVMCPALSKRSDGVSLVCVFGGSEVSTNNCNMPLPVGTEARYSCENYYESSIGLPTVFRKCKEDGTWSGTTDFICIVQCGRENIIKMPFITNSLPTIRGQWPWHAGIFHEREHETWEYICGGTLITKKAILTAAHCVTLFQTTETKDKNDFRVHMGKYRREDNDELVQIKEVAEIIVNPSYNPYSYDSDLAIMIFKNPVNIGYHVRPICFPQTSDTALEELQLSEGTVGTVVGWGLDERSKLAVELRMAHLRVVGSRECSKSMVGSSLTQIHSRSTSYCAGYQNNTNVCNGDSGGGMYFPTKDTDNTKWYLQGLVSVGVSDESGKCDPKQFSVFTRIGRYADFISRILSEHDAL